jgi:hypothetical protein
MYMMLVVVSIHQSMLRETITDASDVTKLIENSIFRNTSALFAARDICRYLFYFVV